MLFRQSTMPAAEARLVDPRLLAHVGDAVFHLFERERSLLSAVSVSQLHQASSRRASADAQATLLDALGGKLNQDEADLVRRARNLKPQRQHRADQAAYRKATAFEALIGYLYLTDTARLNEVLQLTLTEPPGDIGSARKSSPGAP
jgi:ribonuclease III family protein